MGSYLRPEGLEDAVAALADGRCTVLAGGTDFYPARVGRAPGLAADDRILDITALDGLRGITQTAEGFRIGALTTWSDVLRAPLPPLFTALKQAAREVGGVQIQNAGTLAGNLCNASPAADGVPPLLAMDAEVELTSQGGSRRLALDDFILGNRKTAKRADELLTALHIPAFSTRSRSAFLKLGARKYLVISIVMVALLVDLDEDGTVVKARVAVGSCAARAHRLPAVEGALTGQPFDEDLRARIGEEQLDPLAPIDDIRGTAGYRREAAVALIRRGLDALLLQQEGA
ncbi:xanthine dehydrogenase family protein subunit M [Pelagibius sp. 7325]|uniref:FAD binding domain-containing protein n=1 Tax=Pelagibius sp. 7325 TaxID=3131994 RepID=UPI0030EBAF6B